MSLVNGLLVLMHDFIGLFVEAHIRQILLIMLQARVSIVLLFLVSSLHLLFDEVLIGDLCSQAVLTLFLVAMETFDMKFEEMIILIKLIFSSNALGPLFLILIILISRFVKLLFTFIHELVILFYLIILMHSIVNKLTFQPILKLFIS